MQEHGVIRPTSYMQESHAGDGAEPANMPIYPKVFRRQDTASQERGRPCTHTTISQAAHRKPANKEYVQPVVRTILGPKAGRPRRTEHDPHPAGEGVDEKGEALEMLALVEHGHEVGAALPEFHLRVDPPGGLVPRVVDLYQRSVEVEVQGAEEFNAPQYVCDMHLNTMVTR